MEVIDEISDLLQVHVNRDKVVYVAAYGLKFLGSTAESKPLLNASARLATARACTRLFDDAAALKNTFKYGFGKPDGPLWGAVGISYNLFTLGYLQAEKLQFLIDTGVLKVSPEVEFRIRTAHKLFWSLYAFAGLIKSIRALHISAQLVKSPNRTKCAPARFTQATLTTTKLILDVIHAVSWLPPGWLWGSALSTQKASGIATAAGILGLIVHFHGKKLD